jgi:hypothetical protein
VGTFGQMVADRRVYNCARSEELNDCDRKQNVPNGEEHVYPPGLSFRPGFSLNPEILLTQDFPLNIGKAAE